VDAARAEARRFWEQSKGAFDAQEAQLERCARPSSSSADTPCGCREASLAFATCGLAGCAARARARARARRSRARLSAARRRRQKLELQVLRRAAAHRDTLLAERVPPAPRAAAPRAAEPRAAAPRQPRGMRRPR
jgi:hypothetical protein